MGQSVHPIPNSPNQLDKNCIEDSKENYWWDLESVRVTSRGD